jgi:hypothetical protein
VGESGIGFEKEIFGCMGEAAGQGALEKKPGFPVDFWIGRGYCEISHATSTPMK